METDDLDTLGKRLKFARERPGYDLGQSALARKIQCKPQIIQAIEDPRRNIQSSKYTPKLAYVLGVEARWLANKEGPMLADSSAEEMAARVAQIMSAKQPSSEGSVSVPPKKGRRRSNGKAHATH